MRAFKRLNLLHSFTVLLSITILSSLSLSLSDAKDLSSKNRANSVVDVKLHPKGILVGQLFDTAGIPLADKKVALSMVNGSNAIAITNDKGGFAFSGVQGAANLSCGNVSQVVRVWDQDLAPPNSAPAILLVQKEELARGQHYSPLADNIVKRTKRLMSNPLMVAGIVGTAIAVPVAIHNDDDDPAS